VDTTEDLSVRFDAMSDNTAITVGTNRRQRVDRALEAVESVTLSAHDDFKRLVIIVLANLACRHTQFRSRERTLPVVFILHANEIQWRTCQHHQCRLQSLGSRNSSGLTRDGKLSLVAITAG